MKKRERKRKDNRKNNKGKERQKNTKDRRRNSSKGLRGMKERVNGGNKENEGEIKKS